MTESTYRLLVITSLITSELCSPLEICRSEERKFSGIHVSSNPFCPPLYTKFHTSLYFGIEFDPSLQFRCNDMFNVMFKLTPFFVPDYVYLIRNLQYKHTVVRLDEPGQVVVTINSFTIEVLNTGFCTPHRNRLSLSVCSGSYHKVFR